MRKISILLSMLVLAAMILAACGGGATSTNVVRSPLPVTAESTSTSELGTATEMPTEAATETPGIPVTGEVNPARLSNELDFTVWSQDGQQIGEVDDMVLDLDNTQVAYVVVGTSGFLDLGDREILVPWNLLKLQTGTTGTGTGTGTGLATATAGTGTGLATATTSAGTGLATATAGTGTGLATATAGTGTGGNTGGQQNAFILQTDLDTFKNAPDFDLNNLPEMGQPAGDWDLDIRNYWQGAGTGTGLATATAGTGTSLATATTSAGTGLATATPGTSTGGSGTGLATATAGTGTGTGPGPLQGVALASNLLGSTVTIGAQTGTGTGTGLATATAGTGTGGTGLATATAGTGTGTGTGTTVSATITDIIINTDSGKIMYIVLDTSLSSGEVWIPVPLSMFQWDSAAQSFVLNADAAMLQNAPSFPNGQFLDTTVSGWNSEFDTFWQNNGAGGSGTGTGGSEATATPTP